MGQQPCMMFLYVVCVHRLRMAFRHWRVGLLMSRYELLRAAMLVLLCPRG